MPDRTKWTISESRDACAVTQKKRHKFLLSVFVFLFICLAETVFAQQSSAGTSAATSAEVSRIGDALHIEFNGQTDWKYDLKRNEAGELVLKIPRLTDQAAAKLRSHSDSLVTAVKVISGAVDGHDEIVFSTASQTDFFDYMTDQPSRLIVDFFPKTTQDQEQTESTQAKVLPPKVPAEKTDSKRARKPAGTDLVLYAKNDTQEATENLAPESLAEEISSKKDFSHGIFDGGDPEYKRFIVKDYEIKESAIIASQSDFFLPFPMLELGNPQLKALINKPPTYEILTQDNRENKEARVLLNLFKDGKHALFLKTAEEFLLNYPQSHYEEIVNYMIGDVHYSLWRSDGNVTNFEKAMNYYLKMAEKYQQSPMTPRTHLLMGFSYVDRGDSFGALKAFQRFTRQNPTSKHLDRVNVFIAEAYLKLNRFDEAFAILDNVEKNGKIEKMRHEAAFRKGDVYFRKKDYAEAINQYRGAIKRLPASSAFYPNAWYNIAEAEFELRKHRESIDSYRAFLQKFPDHNHGGYAMTRIGELMGILGADPKRAQGAFLESFFRYRATPGAGVARIRVLTSRMPEMKEKELASALREIASITERYDTRPDKKDQGEAKESEGGEKAAEPASQGEGQPAVALAEDQNEAAGRVAAKLEDPTKLPPQLPRIEDFSELLIADGFTARREYDKAASNLIAFFQKNPSSPNHARIKSRIVRNITDGIRASVEKGDFLDALRRYSGNSGTWLKNSDRIDIRYLVGRSYEQAGVYQEAAGIYREVLNKLTEIKGTQSEKERNVFEVLPKAEAVHLRLAAVAARENDFGAAETHLKKITAPDLLKDSEKVERVELAAQVSEARGQVDAAKRYMTELINTWKGEPSLTSPLHLRIARLYIQDRKFADAEKHVSTIIDMRAKSNGVSDDLHAQALELRGELMLGRGKRAEAVQAYQMLLDEYETKRPMASVRYKMGQVLYDDGDLKGAEKVWSEIKTDQSDKAGNLWQRLASEKLQGAKWNKEYKKYLDRIPAAADLRGDGTTKSR